ncbi:MAG TPA: hypothetical protein VJK53_01400 [Candidatus Paceibacterota bacterium]
MELRKSLFWDVDPATIDLDKNARYVIERVLDFGNDEEVRWIFKHYGRKYITDVFNNSADSLTPKSSNFWNIMLNEYLPNEKAWSR